MESKAYTFFQSIIIDFSDSLLFSSQIEKVYIGTGQ